MIHTPSKKKWQHYWEKHRTYEPSSDHTKPKYYVLDMFPYPSGAGLHVGHVVGYTGSDVIARYKRQKGFNVLHPMGWDSFGLPAEQYAIRTGVHPRESTAENINTYRRQLKSLGLSYCWDREIATSDPTYYKWTQWIFTKLYERGLAYESEALVNFCPALGTVLSNEEVENGKSVDGGYPVERRPLRQWVLKITEYAERLLTDLDLVDWPEHLKKLQRNWIGKSEGMNIHFPVEGLNETITCFTTRCDTLQEVTFLAVAPEHPFVANCPAAEAYCKSVMAKSDLERTDLAKTKTGVFSGRYVMHPLTKERIPVWVADYVLMGYGTGAVMGVPAYDERDKEFAMTYGLPVKEGEGDAKTIARELEKIGAGEHRVQYKLRDWLFSRQRYWGEPFPILHFEDGTKRVLELDELPLLPPVMEEFKPSSDGSGPLSKVRGWVEITDPKTGKKAFRETNIMPQWAGSCWYYLRFCDPHNATEAWSKEAEGYWMPVDLYIGGVEHAVLHLLYARFWHKVLYDAGLVSTLEPFQTLRNQGLVVSKAYKLEGGGYVSAEEAKGRPVIELVEKMSKSKHNGVSPDEMIEEYGADALRLYELFMAPFNQEKLWQTDAVNGCRRFLNRVYDLVEKAEECDDQKAHQIVHRLIKGMEEDLQALSFNTAIAKMMEWVNAFSALPRYPKNCVRQFIQMLYPFAPHFGEECWEKLGGTDTISYYPYPVCNPAYLEEKEVTIVVQVQGKRRGEGIFPKGVSQEDVLAYAQADPAIQKFITGDIKKIIFVPDKLLNVVL